LERGQTDPALEVVEKALMLLPQDVRLRQLRGLCFSRKGELGKAVEELEALLRQFPEESESAGITGGVYKRLWRMGKDPERNLARSHQVYHDGWRASRRSSAYLGINAATTALWRGNLEQARPLAAAVRDLLSDRMAALAPPPDGDRPALSFWDQ